MPQFLTKTYEMVDDPSSNAIVSWSDTNQSFIVWSPLDFARDLLPKYFKHSNFSSFIRQLNTYGFKKVDSVRWEFANDNFVRHQPDLLKNIYRRKPVHSHTFQNLHGQGQAPLTKSERQGLKGEIEKLKHEKEQLLMEFQRNELKWKMHEMHFHSSKDRLEKLEHKQQSVLSSISQVLQKPGVASNLGSLIENMDKKLRFSRSDHFNNNTSIGDPLEISQMYFSNNAGIGDPMVEDPLETSQMYFSNNASIEDLMETSQMLQSDIVGSTSVFSSNMERMDLLESSMVFLENVVHDVSGNSIQSHSNIDLGASINCVDGPTISCVQLNVEVQPKSPGINMSVEPAIPVIPNLLEPSMTFLENVVHDVSGKFVQSHSNIDLGESISCMDGSCISCMQLNVEVQPKSPGINMSVEPTVPVIPDILQPSMTFLENVVHDVSSNSVQSHSNIDLGESISCIDGSSISCMQLNVEVQPKSPRINMSVEPAVPVIPDLLLEPSMAFLENGVHDVSGNFVQSHSNIDLGESISCVDGSSTSCMQLNVEVQPKSPKINMSVEPVVPVIPDLVLPMEQLRGTPMAPHPNNQFWEHFLTENPGSH